MHHFIEVAATIMGFVMSLGYYPQAWKMYKTKRSDDISLSTFLILGLGTTTWLLYGIVLRDIPIILGFALGVIGSWTVLFLAIRYRTKAGVEITEKTS